MVLYVIEMPIIFLGGEGAGGLVLCFTEVLLSLERGAWNDAKKIKTCIERHGMVSGKITIEGRTMLDGMMCLGSTRTPKKAK